MTRLLSIVAAILAGAALNAKAAKPPTTQPAKPTVLVLPFATPTGSDATWVGRAARDDIVSGLKRGLDATVRTPSVSRDAADSAAALTLAHQYHANFVIYGYAQETDTIARVTGQVLDVETGLPIGGLKVTGPATSILDIDYALTAQALASLPQSMLKPEAFVMLQQSLQAAGPDMETPSIDGLAMISQSYPVGSTTFMPSAFDDFAALQPTQNVSYVYSPTIIVSAGYGYGGAFAPDYYGPQYAYPVFGFTSPHRHDHGPVFHHGPQRPTGPRGGGDAGVVIAGRSEAGDSSPVTFSWGQNAGPVSTPFMGGGQSFPTQNGFTTIGASSGFSVFGGTRFNNSPRGFSGRGGGR